MPENAVSRKRRKFVFREPMRFIKVTKQEIFGLERVLGEVDKMLFLLKNDKKYWKGIFVGGATGTGKRMLLNYIATCASELGIRFVNTKYFKAEGEDWEANDIRELFSLARQYVSEKSLGGSIILYLDRFEEKFTAAVNALLEELDNLDESERGGIIVICATVKAAKEFDQEITRPGRLDVRLEVGNYNQKNMREMLNFYLSRESHSDFDCEDVIASFTDKVTPAFIKSLVNAAREKSVLRSIADKNTHMIRKDDLVSAFVEKMVGGSSSLVDMDKLATMDTAVHELGHALVGRFLGWPVNLVSVLSADGESGETLVDFDDGSDTDTVAVILDKIAFYFGGSVATDAVGFEESEGVIADLKIVTMLARCIVQNLGLGKITREDYGRTIWAGESLENLSDDLRSSIDRDIGSILKKEELRVRDIFKKLPPEKVLAMAEELRVKKFMLRDDFKELLKRHNVEVPPLKTRQK